MFLRKKHSLLHTLAFRLTVYYAVIFTVSSFLAFMIFYLIISSIIQDNRDQDLLGDLREFTAIMQNKGLEEAKSAALLETKGDGEHNSFIRFFTMNGQEIMSSDLSSWRNMKVSRLALSEISRGTDHVFETMHVQGRRHKARAVYGSIGDRLVIQIGEYLEDDEELLGVFRSVFSAIMIFIIPFATIIGLLMGRHALHGVEQVTQTAMNISTGDLEHRVSVNTNAEEITRLASTFNYMLDRINALVTGMRNMLDDITHDLKKPIARVRIMAEKNLLSSTGDDPYAASILEECDRLIQMIDTILDTSEAESGSTRLHMQHMDMAGIVRKAYELFFPLAEDKNLNFILDIPESCPMTGDIHKIQRMVANLLDNALKYTPSGGEVAISMKKSDQHVDLSIRDTGPGIPGDELPHIFERFHRGDKSRSEAGFGLGLTLARAIAVSHGGDITVHSIPGHGSTFTITLPDR